jgi:hypothetical protein
VLCFDFGTLVFVVTVVANVCIALAAVEDPRPPDTAPISRSAVLTENNAFLAEEIVVIDLSRWSDHLTTEISPWSGVLALTKAR